MTRRTAFLPLGEATEAVLTCFFCREPSTVSLRGTDGWTLVRRSGVNHVDCCPGCQPKKVDPKTKVRPVGAVQ